LPYFALLHLPFVAQLSHMDQRKSENYKFR
jgi:hypothetical protein